ncbi:hypothetical protein [Infirmifilum uzonense]|nr:hypothetical protein [Infirmifilum uzonense]
MRLSATLSNPGSEVVAWSYMRAALAVLLIFLALPPMLEAVPTVYVNYAEVLEYDGVSWKSSYLMIPGTTLSITTSSKILIIRTDAASGKQPTTVLVDGVDYKPIRGTGVLWNTAILMLDGTPHKVEVTFSDVPPRQPILAFFALPGGSTTSPLNISSPPIPGFKTLGIRLVLLLRGGEFKNVVNKPFWVLNQTSITLLGESLQVVEAIVPFENVSLRGDFLKATYSYLYGIEARFGVRVQLPPYPEVFIFVNAPTHTNLSRFPANLIVGGPPKLLMTRFNATSISLDALVYPVSFNVAQPASLCGLTGVSFRVFSSEKSLGTSDSSVLVNGDNTTLLFRFFSSGLSLVDVIVTTPPPRFTLTPPIYTLTFTLLDRSGGKVRNAYYTIYSQGKIVASGLTRNGDAEVCPLPPGEYVILIYLAGNVIARTKIQVQGDSYLPIITNTTTVQITLLREGTESLLTNYTLMLEGNALSYNSSSSSGKAKIEGVIPGKYTFTVYIAQDKVYEGELEVTEAQNVFVFSLPIYQLRIQLLGALNQPIAGMPVVIYGSGIRKTLSTDIYGRVDAGFLPQGQYTVRVGDRAYNVTLVSDSFKSITLDIIAVVNGYIITTQYLELAALLVLIIIVVVVVRKIVKSLKREPSDIIEV